LEKEINFKSDVSTLARTDGNYLMVVGLYRKIALIN